MSNDRLALGRQIYDYFVGKGLAPHQAAAIAGNMAWEGGGRIDLVNPGDNIKNSPRSPHSVGVGQWNDRLPALVDYARKSGINLPDGDLRDAGYVRDVARQLPLNTQLDFAWNEMQGPERRAYEGITSGQDLRSAAAGAIGYHRPAGWTRSNPYAGHGFDNRVAIADQILRASQAGGASVPAPSGMSGSAFHAAAFPAPYALGGPKQAAEPVSTSSAAIPVQAKTPATEQPRAPAWDAAGFWDKQMLEGHADGGAVGDDLLADYRAATQSDPLADYRTKFRNDPPVSGYQPRSFGTLSATPDRPSDWAVSSGLAETLSPIGQGYGAGQMAGDAYQAAKAGDYGSATGGGLLAAMSMLPMKKGAPVAAAEKPAGIRAYHGSPHDFDKFDMSKIGTGEGAQAYGHGMYFAENEGVAKDYRRVLTGNHNGEQFIPMVDNKFVEGPSGDLLKTILQRYRTPENFVDAMQPRLEAARKKAATASKADELGMGISDHDIALVELQQVEKQIAEARGYIGRDVKMSPPGRMYEVNIKADPEHFLDWDKPLSQQSEKVRQAIEKVAPPKSRDEIQAAHDAYKQANADWMARPENVDTTTAAALENAVGDAYKNWRVAQGLSGSGSRIYTDLARGKPYSEGANALRDAGIPGIRYLDQGSRGAGEGSRNYVVFDPATIEILRKYGILGPMAAGVGAGAMQDSPEGFAEGGPVTLDEYRSAMPDDPLNAYRTQLKTGPDMVAPWDVPGTKSPVTGTLSNPAPRPGEYLAPAYEAVSPMVGGYGLAQGLGDVYNYAKEGDWKGVAESGIPLAAMAVMPGPKAKKLGALETPFYHGTTHEINPTTGFKDPRRGGPYTAESHHGAAPYLTSSESDARGNYAGVGPDLTGRIAQHAERLENDIDGMDRSDQARALLDYRRAQREGLLPDYAQKFGYSQRDAAKAWGNAFSQLVGPKVEGEVHQLVPIPQNPVRLDAFEGKPATHFDFGRAYVDQDAKKGDYVVYDQNGKKIARYPDEADAYDHADNMQPDGPAAKMIEHIRSVSPELADEVYMKMIDYDGMSAKNFEDTVRKSDHVYDLYDDNGEMMGPGQIIQDAYRAAGYDAVIMPNADQQFKNMGLARGTTHIAMFDHTKVRKPEAKFDPKKKDSGNWLAGIAATLGIGGGSAAMNGDMGGSDYRRDYANGGRVGRALAIASKLVDRNPTDAQKESGNYAKGHAKVHGLDVTIENPKGSERSGMGKDGKRWSVKMPAIYGYVKGTEGFDGDHVDVYIGPDHDSKKVFVVDQINAEDGKFDEHKCLLSYPTKEAALADYRKAFSDGKADQRIGAVTEMTIDRFKSWVKSAGTQVPLGDIRKKYANGGAVIADEDLLSDYR